jgi:hypothetical protein
VSRWFRFYAEAMRNPKVMRLSDKDFRLWVELLAVASENAGSIPCLDDLKVMLKRRLGHLSTSVERLISVGLIDALGDGYEPHNWSKFQYKSDTSNERVTKHRAKRNVTVTPPETDTETELPLANANGPVIDPEKVMFDAGVSLLKEAGKSELAARSWLGKAKRDHGAELVITMIGKAKREGALDPIAFMEGGFRAKARASPVMFSPC